MLSQLVADQEISVIDFNITDYTLDTLHWTHEHYKNNNTSDDINQINLFSQKSFTTQHYKDNSNSLTPTTSTSTDSTYSTGSSSPFTS